MTPVAKHPIGQQLLQALSQDRLHHALLFIGEGSEKDTFASAWAKHLLCLNASSAACGECQSCHYRTLDTHPDVVHLQQDLENKATIDDVREIIAFVAQSTHTAKRKVVIIEAAHLLNMAAQNALLKVLEEPPAQAYFILCTNKPNLLLPTIKSRCLLLRFRSLDTTQALEQLQQAIQQQPEFAALKNCSEVERLDLLQLSNGVVDDVVMWHQSPVWQQREDLVRAFVYGENAQTSITQLFHRHAEQALYLLYLKLSQCMRDAMGIDTVYKFMTSITPMRPNNHTAVYYADYAQAVVGALRHVMQSPGLNKLLLFQSLQAQFVETA